MAPHSLGFAVTHTPVSVDPNHLARSPVVCRLEPYSEAGYSPCTGICRPRYMSGLWAARSGRQTRYKSTRSGSALRVFNWGLLWAGIHKRGVICIQEGIHASDHRRDMIHRSVFWRCVVADDEIKKIIEKRDQLRQELQKIDNFLELYRDLTGTELVQTEPSGKLANVDNFRRRGRKRTPGTVSPSDLGPMIRRILLEHGKPMTRSELLRALEGRDVKLAGEDKARYLGTIMWRMREAFVNIDGYGYWPKDVEWGPDDPEPVRKQNLSRLGMLAQNVHRQIHFPDEEVE